MKEPALLKEKRKQYANGQGRRGQIPNSPQLSKHSDYIDDRKQVRHWEGGAVMGANHKQAIVTVVECKGGYALIAMVENKTVDLVGAAIVY